MTTDKEEQKQEVKEKKEFELIQIPTQHTLAIQSSDGKLMSTEEAIVMILNNMTELKKNLIG